MGKYIKDKTGDTIYTGLILPEHSAQFIKSIGGYRKYHQHLMDINKAAPVYDLIDGKTQYVGLRIIKHKPIPLEKKIGRNELCPCGSGHKYKKCCTNKK